MGSPCVSLPKQKKKKAKGGTNSFGHELKAVGLLEAMAQVGLGDMFDGDRLGWIQPSEIDIFLKSA